VDNLFPYDQTWWGRNCTYLDILGSKEVQLIADRDQTETDEEENLNYEIKLRPKSDMNGTHEDCYPLIP